MKATRSKTLRAKMLWAKEWEQFKAQGQVKPFASMLEALPHVLMDNEVQDGWHWCILLQKGNRGQVSQIGVPFPQANVDVDGKMFQRINTVTIVVQKRTFILPLYEEVPE